MQMRRQQTRLSKKLFRPTRGITMIENYINDQSDGSSIHLSSEKSIEDKQTDFREKMNYSTMNKT